jgi:lysozyme
MKRNAKIYYIIGGALLLTFLIKRMGATKLIAQFEGLKLNAYQDTGGVWTIGYGSTYNPFTFVKVKPGDKITEAEALRWLKKAVGDFRKQVEKLVKVPQTANQLDALTSLAYNIGIEAFQRSTLLRLINQGAPVNDIADQFLRWNRIKSTISRGLTNRRTLERKLYLS